MLKTKVALSKYATQPKEFSGTHVMPMQPGNQLKAKSMHNAFWFPACAGMTNPGIVFGIENVFQTHCKAETTT